MLRGFRQLVFHFHPECLDGHALSQCGQILDVRLARRDFHPALALHDSSVRAKRFVLDNSLDARQEEHRFRVELFDEPAYHQVVDDRLIVRQRLAFNTRTGWYDSVVVRNLLIVEGERTHAPPFPEGMLHVGGILIPAHFA